MSPRCDDKLLDVGVGARNTGDLLLEMLLYLVNDAALLIVKQSSHIGMHLQIDAVARQVACFPFQLAEDLKHHGGAALDVASTFAVGAGLTQGAPDTFPHT